MPLNPESLIGRSINVYFFSQPGCAHCAVQRPVFNALRTRMLGRIMMLELDANKHESIDDWSPRGTPAFAIKVDNILMATHEGTLTLAGLERMIEKAANGRGDTDDETPPPRKRRRAAKARREAPDSGGDAAEGDERGSATGSDDS